MEDYKAHLQNARMILVLRVRKHRAAVRSMLPIACCLLISFGMAQSNQDCLDCHDDREFSMERAGREISLNVSPAKYAASAHAKVKCIECHKNFDPEEEPHLPLIPPVDCSACHEQSTAHFQASGHRSEINCASCHGDPHVPGKSAILMSRCADCHKEEANAFASGVHAEIPHKLQCNDCHSSHRLQAVDSKNCLSCHGRVAEEGDLVQLQRSEVANLYLQSAHVDAVDCYECHGTHAIFPPDSLQSTVHRQKIAQTCNECHDDVVEEFLASEHGRSFSEGFAQAPGCTDCHDGHAMHNIDDNRSLAHRSNEIKLCLSCHADNEAVRERMSHTTQFVAGYESSVHGRLSQSGDSKAAICSDCHGAHQAMKSSNPASKVSKFKLVETCGSCHDEIAREFKQSIHGIALDRGIMDAPTCTDCHGEHNILEQAMPASAVSAQNVSAQTCGSCHNSVRMAEKYGLASDRFSAYNDSYHGLAVKLGDVEAANCASCHGVHNILPSSDEKSMIHPVNLVNTCGSCHPGANRNFAKGKVHLANGSAGNDLTGWIAYIYILLIGVTIGGMGIHNLLDWQRKIRHIYRERYTVPDISALKKRAIHYTRMALAERIQHWLLIISFFTLVFTGFMLKFPDAWWMNWIRGIGGEVLFQFRGDLHRVAAVVMIAVSLYHIYYLIFVPRGRAFIREMLPVTKDLRDTFSNLRYNLGVSAEKPRFDRFSYIEKAEYWALMWGTVVMTLTGIALWFENQTMNLLSKTAVDVAEVIHYYEAWLAFLAILVWHFYYVIFNPDVYPMNFTWLHGKVSEAEMEAEHPIELERMKKEVPPQKAEGDEKQ